MTAVLHEKLTSFVEGIGTIDGDGRGEAEVGGDKRDAVQASESSNLCRSIR